MNTFKEKCIELRKQNYTLNEIVRITGRPKTSVYEYISQIPLSEDKLKAISLASGIRAKAIALTRKDKSIRSFKRFTKWDKNNVSLVAHLIFDGTINRTSCIYNNRNMPLLEKVENAMKTVYDFEPNRYLNPETGVSRISYFNVTLGSYMIDKSLELLKDIANFPVDLKIEFLRAFFDDEGCMDFRPKRNRRQIRGYQKNMNILLLVQKLLKSIEINSFIALPNEIVVSQKYNLELFQKKINFSEGVRLNGNRSNSIWKKSLEKRILLRQAIKSFKH